MLIVWACATYAVATLYHILCAIAAVTVRWEITNIEGHVGYGF
jgi:hypothetical protein